MLKKTAMLFVFIIAICTLLGFSYYNKNYALEGIGENHLIYSKSTKGLFINQAGLMTTKNAKAETCIILLENFHLKDFLTSFNADLVAVEEYEGGISYYAFTKKIKYREEIYGKIVNLHIAIQKDTVKIGSPIIYTSF